MNIIVGCECSGEVRRAMRARGHNAWSCDLKPAEDGSPYHIQGNLLMHLDGYYPGHGRSPVAWDMGIFHPDCTFMCNSGVHHLVRGGKRINPHRRIELDRACDFFLELWNAPIEMIGMENPVMHCHAKERIGVEQTQTVQPWWFGEKAFKATCLWLKGLPSLNPTNKLTPPAPGTEEHKRWSKIHRESPGPNRKANRSRTFTGISEAMADQWSNPEPLFASPAATAGKEGEARE